MIKLIFAGLLLTSTSLGQVLGGLDDPIVRTKTTRDTSSSTTSAKNTGSFIILSGNKGTITTGDETASTVTRNVVTSTITPQGPSTIYVTAGDETTSTSSSNNNNGIVLVTVLPSSSTQKKTVTVTALPLDSSSNNAKATQTTIWWTPSLTAGVNTITVTANQFKSSPNINGQYSTSIINGRTITFLASSVATAREKTSNDLLPYTTSTLKTVTSNGVVMVITSKATITPIAQPDSTQPVDRYLTVFISTVQGVSSTPFRLSGKGSANGGNGLRIFSMQSNCMLTKIILVITLITIGALNYL